MLLEIGHTYLLVLNLLRCRLIIGGFLAVTIVFCLNSLLLLLVHQLLFRAKNLHYIIDKLEVNHWRVAKWI